MARPRSWTDDDLRRAVEESHSLAEVVRRLRLRHGGAAYTTVRTRIEQLDLDASHLGATGRVLPGSDDGPREAATARRWSEQDLQEAVAKARSLREVFVRLGLTPGGSQWLTLRQLILDRAWPTDHWRQPLTRHRTPLRPAAAFRAALEACDDLAGLVAASKSRAAVIRSLGFDPAPPLYRTLRQRLASLDISTDHFEPAHAAMRRSRRRRYRQSLDAILVEDSTYTSTATLKQRLIEEGLLEPACARCGLDCWLGAPITLHLDHVNGIRNDHRLDNLRLLCPNCHAQTPTYGGRNVGRYAVAG